MEEAILIGALVLFCGPSSLILVLVLWSRVGTHRRRIEGLEAALAGLERRLAAAPVAADAAPETMAEPVEPTLPADEPREPEPEFADDAPEPVAAREAPPEVAARAAPVRPPRPSLEERIGTRWTVWLGGVALALGLVLLVRQSIEAGLVGPEVRVLLGVAVSFALMAASEGLRRRGGRFLGGRVGAHLPAVVAAAGACGLFADVWASHALYGFLGPTTAFLALGVVAVATILATVVHGPWFGGLGILAGYATPLLVHSAHPNPDGLVGYLFAVTVAAFAIARLRRFRAFATFAFLLDLAWGAAIPATFPATTLPEIAATLHGLGLLLATAAILVLDRPRLAVPEEDRPLDRRGLLLLAAATLFIVPIAADAGSTFGATALVVTVVGLFGLAALQPSVAPAAAIAAIASVAAIGLAELDVARTLTNDTFARGADGLVALRPRAVAAFLGFHGGLGAVLLAAGLVSARLRVPAADRGAGWFAFAAWFAGVGGLVVAWGRVSAFETDTGFAAVSLGLAAALAAATADLVRREEAPSRAVAQTAIGVIVAIGTAAVITLDRANLTIVLALMLPAIVWVHGRRPIPVLKAAVAVGGLVVLGRVLWTADYTLALGAPARGAALRLDLLTAAVGTLWAAWRFRSEPVGLVRTTIEALAITFTGLFAAAEIRVVVDAVGIADRRYGELGLDLALILALAVAARRGFRAVAALFLGQIVEIALACAALTMLFGLAIGESPLLTGRPTGTGTLALGLLVPALVAVAAARLSRRTGEPGPVVAGFGCLAWALGLLWASLALLHGFRGPVLTRAAGGAEDWALSAVWLGWGVATLAVGLKLGSRPIRLLSAATITATAAKVFLWDLAEATGFWRAASMFGLGLVLIGIAVVYQRLLFPPRRDDGPGARTPGGSDAPDA